MSAKKKLETGLPALTVDVAGLARLVERRGKDFAVMELVQNAWDEDTTRVEVTLEYHSPDRALLVVEDDSPDGFHDMSHAYTLFANSKKKDDPEKRGRFNMGEKLVIALADQVKVISVNGAVLIDPVSNARMDIPDRRERGSRFEAVLRMTEREIEDSKRKFRTLIQPPDVWTFLNGEALAERVPVLTFEALLTTEVADESGTLRPTRRKCEVQLYNPQPGETAMVYEMGLPVVESGDKWHVNVMQKVPLNTDRDNITPSYLRDLRAHVLNEAAHLLNAQDASESWVSSTLGAKLTDPAAVETVLDKRFGEKRVAYDPSDQEANKLAVAAGYSVLHAGTMDRSAWDKVRQNGFVPAAGKVTPSNSVVSGTGEGIHESKWTDGMRTVHEFSKMLAREALGFDIEVNFTVDVTQNYLACYGGRTLTYNKGKLGKAWFDRVEYVGINDDVIDLFIHELGHEYESDHLSESYYRALTRVSAKVVRLALNRRDLFEPFGLVS